MEDITKFVGKRIREIRKNLGLTQEQVAEKAGMDFTSIGAAERGVRGLSLKSLYRIAQALEVPIEEIVCLPKKEEKDLTIDELTVLIKDLDKTKLKFILDFIKLFRDY
ncbi:MAG: helix-turn-helix transcriptional regulator [Nitrospirota bacterium]